MWIRYMEVSIYLLPIKREEIYIYSTPYPFSLQLACPYRFRMCPRSSCFLMESHYCDGSIWASDDILTWFQFVSDLLIALSYFVIPLELVFLARKSSLAPYLMIFVQFEAFIVLCGATHLINLWVLSCPTKTVDVVQTVAKVFCAITSCATAITLLSIIRAFLTYKLELSLKSNASESDTEKGLVKFQEGTIKTEY